MVAQFHNRVIDPPQPELRTIKIDRVRAGQADPWELAARYADQLAKHQELLLEPTSKVREAVVDLPVELSGVTVEEVCEWLREVELGQLAARFAELGLAQSATRPDGFWFV